jgi:L-aminopeptidase/D-esterase-like protein
MASTSIEVADTTVRVAALAVVNASGSLVDPATGAPWVDVPRLRRPTRSERDDVAAVWRAASAPPMNTTLGVVAADADLSRPETGRLAQSAHDGLARAIRPAHGLTDGDTVFGLATGSVPLPDARDGLVRSDGSRVVALNRLFAAAADVFATACADALLNAAPTGDPPSYAAVCPSAFRAVADGPQ